MYYYIQSEHAGQDGAPADLFTVGHDDSTGKWHPNGDFGSEIEAADRVALLNFGPQPERKVDPDHLTKRERFAMAALQGILANPSNSHVDVMGVNGRGELGFIAGRIAVREAVIYADALLEELDKKETDPYDTY